MKKIAQKKFTMAQALKELQLDDVSDVVDKPKQKTKAVDAQLRGIM